MKSERISNTPIDDGHISISHEDVMNTRIPLQRAEEPRELHSIRYLKREFDTNKKDHSVYILEKDAYENLLYELHANNQPFSLLTADLTRMKSLNENHGHRKGDEILKLTTLALASTIRDIKCHFFHEEKSTPVVCRIGGDEYGAMIPYVITDEMYNAAKALFTANLKKLYDELAKDSELKYVIDAHGGITMGIGYTIYFGEEDERELDTIIDESDYAMNLDKANMLVAEIPIEKRQKIYTVIQNLLTDINADGERDMAVREVVSAYLAEELIKTHQSSTSAPETSHKTHPEA